jgi:hypothetical protein
MDPYAYVGNNPETRSDPTGQMAIDMDSAGVEESQAGNLSAGGGGSGLGELIGGIAAVIGAWWQAAHRPPGLVCSGIGLCRPSSTGSTISTSAIDVPNVTLAPSTDPAIGPAGSPTSFPSLISIFGSIAAAIAAAIDWSGPDQPPAKSGNGVARVGAQLQALDDNGQVVAQASSRSQPPDPNDPNQRKCAEYWLCQAFDWQKLKDSGVLKVLLKIVSRSGIPPCDATCMPMLMEIAQKYGISISVLLYISTRNNPSSVWTDVINLP